MNKKIFFLLIIIIFEFSKVDLYSQVIWEIVESPTNQLLTSVHFVDSLYGWAVGDSGTIIHTSNGGNSWDLQNSNTVNKISDVFFLNRNLGWASSWNTTIFPFGTVILKTTNGGQTWTGDTYPNDNIFIQCILYLDSLNGWMGGKPHALVSTSDGGQQWKQADIDSSLLAFFPVSNIHFYNSQYGYACGGAFEYAGVVWKTTNGGNKWFAIDITNAPADPIHEIYIFDTLNVIGVSGDFEIFGVSTIRTTDGGLFWEYDELGMPGVASDIAFRNDYEAWATIRLLQSLIYSSDSGSTWIQIPAPGNSAITDLFFPDSLHGYAVGEHGAIIKYKPTFRIPVELFSFEAAVHDDVVTLSWSTATETNNQGFEVQRKSEVIDYESIGYIEGYGTTTETKLYSYTDSNLSMGSYKYRLKQIDFDGSVEYSDEVSVKVTLPREFALLQNYPNPFNPKTVIQYSIPEFSFVRLDIFNSIGEEIKTLAYGMKNPGSYEIDFNASDLPSGVYFYKLQAGGNIETKKMILIK